ncbi:MAG: PAS domain-containing protein, partial [Chthoniobacteraceae bacterium]
MDQISALVWIDDLEGNRLFTNRFAAKFWACSPEELKGLAWIEHWHPKDQAAYRQSFARAVEPRE